jgi:hypothetical protein
VELTSDAAAAPVFGSGVHDTPRRSRIPWAMIVGAALTLALLILLMTR